MNLNPSPEGAALLRPASPEAMPEVVDQVALARLYGEPLFQLPQDLYIPPDALEVFLEAFEGPLDLLLYLIRKQNFNILDIPLADSPSRRVCPMWMRPTFAPPGRTSFGAPSSTSTTASRVSSFRCAST